MAGYIYTTVTLKPLRLAFLIRPADTQSLLTSVETCTLLWGGVWNPIIPAYTRAPQYSRDRQGRRPSIRAWIDHHLSFFEPEVVVLGPGVTAPPGYHSDSILPLDQLHASAMRGEPLAGLSINHVHRHLYETQLRFVERTPSPPLVVSEDGERDSPHVAVVQGRLPVDPNSINAADIQEIFGGTRRPFDSQLLDDRYRRLTKAPISITGEQVPRWYGGDPVIVIYDPRRLSDLICLWNIRACTHVVTAIPVTWAADLRELFLDSVRRLYREPDAQGFGAAWPHIYLCPGVSPDAWRELAEPIEQELRNARAMIEQAPQFWEHQTLARRWQGWLRREVSSRHGQMQLDDEGYGKTTLLQPEFVHADSLAWSESWANHISFGSRFGGDECTLAVSLDRLDAIRLLGSLHWPYLRQSRAGISLRSRGLRDEFAMRLPTGEQQADEWYRSLGWTSSVSGAGRLTKQLIASIGGPRATRHLCTPTILSACGHLKEGRRATRGQVLKLLEHDELEEDPLRSTPERELAIMLDRGALQLGLELQCSVCGQREWYSPASIGLQLLCPVCRSSFAFPTEPQPERAWTYRTQGPFAMSSMAEGTFPVALTIAWFYELHHYEAAFAVSRDLKRQGGQVTHQEVDATVFLRGEGRDRASHVALCECKSTKSFSDDDISRLHLVGGEVPNAVLTFACMRSRLRARERQLLVALLRRLATETGGSRFDRTRLLILTGNELHSGWSLERAWKRAGGRCREFAEGPHVNQLTHTLEDLCEVTQHLYLSDAPAATHPSESIRLLLAQPGPRRR